MPFFGLTRKSLSLKGTALTKISKSGLKKTRREQKSDALYTLICETMASAGATSSSFRFTISESDPKSDGTLEYIIYMDLEYESSSSLRNMTRITSKIQKQAFAHWAIVVKALYFRFECWTDSPKATKSSRANEVNLASSTLTQMGLACPASQIPHTFFSSPTDATSIQSTIQSTSQLDSQPVAFSSSSSEPTVISEDEEKKPTYNKTLRRA